MLLLVRRIVYVILRYYIQRSSCCIQVEQIYQQFKLYKDAYGMKGGILDARVPHDLLVYLEIRIKTADFGPLYYVIQVFVNIRRQFFQD